MVGQTIGKYRIVEQIGRGGMGTVYKAIDETLNRRVALKLLNADLIDPDAVERFRREALMLAKLNHGRIGAIHELTRDGHDLLMVMEFLEGETFEKLIERGPMTVPRAVALCSQVLEALEYAHGAGVIHRDLKPANLMLSPSGDIKVMDFGIARVQGSEHLTTNGYMVGTPAYMAPEQVRGEEVDPRMDLYSVAVVLYRMLTHHLPFHGDTAIAMIHSQLNNPPTPPQQFRADLPGWIVGILDRGLAKKPGDRFQSAREFRVALEKGLTGKAPSPKPTTAPTSSGMPAPPATRNMPAPPATRNIPAPSPTGTFPGSSTASLSSSSVAPSPDTASAAMPSAAMPRVDAAPQPPAPPPAGSTTVTLRTGHLATIGGLVLALVIGGGALAYIALRQPATTVIVPASSTSQTASAPDTPQQPPVSAPVGLSATRPEPATSPAAAAPAPAPRVPEAPRTPTAPAPAANQQAATAARNAAATPNGAAPSGDAAATGPATAPAAPALPAAASAPAQDFGEVKAVVFEGSKSREVDAQLSLEPGNLVVRGKSGNVLRTVPYSSIAAATYARARRPRGQTVAGASNVPDDVISSGLFSGARHWLTLQLPNDYVIIRLEDRNVIPVLNGLEARTGTRIPRTQSN